MKFKTPREACLALIETWGREERDPERKRALRELWRRTNSGENDERLDDDSRH